MSKHADAIRGVADRRRRGGQMGMVDHDTLYRAAERLGELELDIAARDAADGIVRSVVAEAKRRVDALEAKCTRLEQRGNNYGEQAVEWAEECAEKDARIAELERLFRFAKCHCTPWPDSSPCGVCAGCAVANRRLAGSTNAK